VHCVRGTAECSRRHDTHVAMSNVDPLARYRIANGTDTGRRIHKLEMRRSRRSNSTNANTADKGDSGRWRDDNNVMARTRKLCSEILQMELEPTEPRVIPVADECDPQLANGIESRP
jgi:hypothetical protein